MRRIMLCLGLFLGVGAVAHATTILFRGTEKLFHDADVVAVAEVHDVHAVQAGGSITTHAMLVLTEGIKGPATGTAIEVVTEGGIVGRWGQHVEGAPAVTEGERCVVFLTKNGSRYRFTGMEEGKVPIEGDSAIHSLTARFVERDADGTLREAQTGPASEPLAAYLDHLRQLARAQP